LVCESDDDNISLAFDDHVENVNRLSISRLALRAPAARCMLVAELRLFRKRQTPPGRRLNSRPKAFLLVRCADIGWPVETRHQIPCELRSLCLGQTESFLSQPFHDLTCHEIRSDQKTELRQHSTPNYGCSGQSLVVTLLAVRRSSTATPASASGAPTTRCR
jgi:hypothetical protein